MDTILALQGLPLIGANVEGADSQCNCPKSTPSAMCSTSSCCCVEGATADMYF